MNNVVITQKRFQKTLSKLFFGGNLNIFTQYMYVFCLYMLDGISQAAAYKFTAWTQTSENLYIYKQSDILS